MLRYRPDFAAAARLISLNVKRMHHGRDPIEGLDCLGYLICLYRLAGLPIDDLDTPYSERDADHKSRTERIRGRLQLRFRSLPVGLPADCKDGDVLLMASGPGRANHVGVVISGCLFQMANRLRIVALRNAMPFACAKLRHQAVADYDAQSTQKVVV